CFFSSRRRHTRSKRDWSSDVCSSDLQAGEDRGQARRQHHFEELRAALAAQHARRLEQPRVDRAHAEDRVDEDRVERAEKDQKERSEERRVGKEWRSWWSAEQESKRT